MTTLSIEEACQAYVSSRNPHPWPLKVSAEYIIPNRLTRAKEAPEAIVEHAKALSLYADDLQRNLDRRWIDACRAYSLTNPTGDRRLLVTTQAGGCHVNVSTGLSLKAFKYVRRFDLFDSRNAHEDDGL